jgi:hypothetical protein
MPKFTINIDFDEASRQWRIHTQADNPTALRKKQRAYWREVRRATGPTRRSSRTTTGTKRKTRVMVTPTNGGGHTRAGKRRSCGPPSRLINEC